VDSRLSPDRAAVLASLRRALAAARNPDGGWSYRTGAASRLEPTCWALVALGGTGDEAARAFLARCQRPDGWLVEQDGWPINIGFNAMAAAIAPDTALEAAARVRLLAALERSHGIAIPPSAEIAQDNSLQGWSWNDATFSWVEPTAWALLAFKRARRTGTSEAAAVARIADGERLLVDRCCREGGWNFGNANVMRQDLRPYVPTTALALMAMQDRRGSAEVDRSIAFLQTHATAEASANALGLARIALDTLGLDAGAVDDALVAETPRALAFGSLHTLAVALCALSRTGRDNVFRL
jgi:hypothetical protein